LFRFIISSLSFRAKSRNPAAVTQGNAAGSFDSAQDDKSMHSRSYLGVE
jgi:hypothetical protein